MANARLGWFSPLGVAASIRASAGRVGLRASASAFRHAPLRSCPRRVGLRAHRSRFSARTASELPLGELVFGLIASAFRHAPLRSCHSASWPSGSLLPLFGMHRFGLPSAGWRFRLPFRRLPFGGLAFGFTASAFRHAPLRKLPLGGLAFGLLLPLFGTHRSAPPYRRREDRRSTPTRHLFHFKTLISTC